MLFHVTMTVKIPRDIDQAEIKAIREQEHQRASDLQQQGKWLHLWRVVGQFANVSIFKVDSPGELHSILESLPLYPFMTVAVTALCQHPGAFEKID